MLKEIGRNKSVSGNSIFLPHGPSAVTELRRELRESQFMKGLNKK